MSAIPDPDHSLTPSGNLRRRQLVSRVFVGGAVAAAALAVAVLLILVYTVFKHGASAISLGFLTKDLPPFTGQGGGIGPALVGTFIMVLIATVDRAPGWAADSAVPVGIRRSSDQPRGAADARPDGRPADDHRRGIRRRPGREPLRAVALAGGLALSIVEVPLIARASLESISRVPETLREAADALGVARWRSILGVVLPTASNGIVTATILAVARAAGETAPILFTSALFTQSLSVNPRQSIASVPLLIFQLLESGFPASIDKAWGAAFVLMMLILAANIGARVWLRRSERKRGL